MEGVMVLASHEVVVLVDDDKARAELVRENRTAEGRRKRRENVVERILIVGWEPKEQ
jgi:hypothetical protein